MEENNKRTNYRNKKIKILKHVQDSEAVTANTKLIANSETSKINNGRIWKWTVLVTICKWCTVGCAVVVGTCFGVPSIRTKLLGSSTSSSSTNSNSNNLSTGYVSQTSLSNYSDTSVYAANKILPSIVGIKVEYNVNSLVIYVW